MNTTTKLVSWKNNNTKCTIASVPISVDTNASELKVREFIIDALNNKPNDVLSFNWSNFGKNGDYIVVEDIEFGGDFYGTITESI